MRDTKYLVVLHKQDEPWIMGSRGNSDPSLPTLQQTLLALAEGAFKVGEKKLMEAEKMSEVFDYIDDLTIHAVTGDLTDYFDSKQTTILSLGRIGGLMGMATFALKAKPSIAGTALNIDVLSELQFMHEQSEEEEDTEDTYEEELEHHSNCSNNPHNKHHDYGAVLIEALVKHLNGIRDFEHKLHNNGKEGKRGNAHKS